jgi:outer membrane protein assembly factor BamB
MARKIGFWAALALLAAGCGKPKLLWKAETGAPAAKLAPLISGTLALVPTLEGVTALRLEDGHPAWSWTLTKKNEGLSGLSAPNGGVAVLNGGRLALLNPKDGLEMAVLESGANFLGASTGPLLACGGGGNIQALEVKGENFVRGGLKSLDGGQTAYDAAVFGDKVAFNFSQDALGGPGVFNFADGAPLWQSVFSSPPSAAPFLSGELLVTGDASGPSPMARGMLLSSGMTRWEHIFHQDLKGDLKVAWPPAALNGILAFTVRGLSGTELVALDAASGRERWKQSLGNEVSERELTLPVASQNGVCLAAGTRLMEVSEAGEIVWEISLKKPVQHLVYSWPMLLSFDESGQVQAFRLSE